MQTFANAGLASWARTTTLRLATADLLGRNAHTARGAAGLCWDACIAELQVLVLQSDMVAVTAERREVGGPRWSVELGAARGCAEF